MFSASVYSIPASNSFVDVLAKGLLNLTEHQPETLADFLILLPTRRACRSLQEAFLRQSQGGALILPRMQPLGDVDEEELILSGPIDEAGALTTLLSLPPAIGDTERLLQLTRLVRAQRNALAERDPSIEKIGPDQALLLARELARLLDQIQTEGLDLKGLEKLVPEFYANHWAETIAFLDILRTAWPAHLAEEGKIDPAERRRTLMKAQAEAWSKSPPSHPVIAAGSTGSIPAAADLIAAVSGLPQGCVILPGLDFHLEADAWIEAGETPSHPQYGLVKLLARLGIEREDVALWQMGGEIAAVPSEITPRVRLISEAMRPAATTDHWNSLDAESPGFAQAFDGVDWLETPSQASEAELAAQGLRETLETPGKTAALITPDRALARRVAAQMQRWGIEIDDSAGKPLGQTERGRYFKLVAECVAKRLSPVALLSLLKHPLSAGGQNPVDFRDLVRSLELACLRGPKPTGGILGIDRALTLRQGDIRNPPTDRQVQKSKHLLEVLDQSLGSLVDWMAPRQASFAAMINAHIKVAEALCTTDVDDGAERLWAGEDGEVLAEFLADLLPVGDLLGQVSAGEYVALIDAMMQGKSVRPRYGTHPRLAILGPLEARLQHADRVILAGLNEGTWPPDPGDDPWMSQAMRVKFGLPPHERRIGLAAHDFAQAFAAPEVILLRAEKSGSQQTVPSRWLERLETVSLRLGLAGGPADTSQKTAARLSWQHQLDRADRAAPLARPIPKPALNLRPRKLSATRIETWIRDPYSIFAQYILKLTKLDDLEKDLGASDKGTMIHAALDQFLKTYPDHIPPDAEQQLLQMGRGAFGAEALARPSVMAFWWPRFEKIARWFLMLERQRREIVLQSVTEIRGQTVLQGPNGPFTLSAEADRIDRLREGGYAILDYKTGGVPTQVAVKTLASPQLVLEAAILLCEGFPGLDSDRIEQLAYWKLSGGEPAGKVTEISKIDPNELAEQVIEKLQALIDAFDDPDTGYPALPRPEMGPSYNDYAHLARHREWLLGEGGDT